MKHSHKDYLDDFKLDDFFDTYSSFFKFMPSGVAERQGSGYTEDWEDISRSIKQEFNYVCQQCSLDLKQNHSLLHTHHINGVKSDNSFQNLTPLCADCHRKQPDHTHLFVTREETQMISRLRHQQGLVIKEDWEDVYKFADPGLNGVIDMLEQYKAPLPEVGEEVENDQNEVITELELAWPLKKIGVAIDKESAVLASKLGWKVYSMRHALSQFEQLVASLR